MKAFLLGMIAMVVISGGAMLAVDYGFDFSAATVYQSDQGSVRVGCDSAEGPLPGSCERPR